MKKNRFFNFFLFFKDLFIYLFLAALGLVVARGIFVEAWGIFH